MLLAIYSTHSRARFVVGVKIVTRLSGCANMVIYIQHKKKIETKKTNLYIFRAKQMHTHTHTHKSHITHGSSFHYNKMPYIHKHTNLSTQPTNQQVRYDFVVAVFPTVMAIRICFEHVA